ncbi:MAG: L,D-transpeptidase family protein, partial [Prolixibacteraceae bacterium]|nr:L,D-transpeptidase family protein [Prolixibacteraceae bacterium]
MVIQTDNLLAQQFYAANHQTLFWLSSKKNIQKAKEWLAVMDSSHRYGILPDQLQINEVRSAFSQKNKTYQMMKNNVDQQITGLVLNYLKELQEGNIRFDYDEVKAARDTVYILQLFNTKPKETVSEMVALLDCKDLDYLILKNYLNDSITAIDTLKYKMVLMAMNYRRYLNVNHQPDFILVNIPEAIARYFNNSSQLLEMRAVVGRKRTPTPTISSFVTNVVTFPLWNVPHSIAVKEILPKIQKDDLYFEQSNLYVVDGKGNTVDDSLLIWSNFTARNFPYYFRQPTGAINALGVLKFNLQNPFSVFLHSTNLQSGFLKEDRFLSHGCIRLEKPIDLAESLLSGKLNVEELKRGKKYTVSSIVELPQKLPVFIIYSPAIVTNNSVSFLPDV